MRVLRAASLLPLLLGGLLFGGCGDPSPESAAPPPRQVTQGIPAMDAPDAPPADPQDSGGRPCGWPDACGPPTARAMLAEIVERAEADEVKQAIAPEVLERIRNQVPRIQDPQLTSAAGRHVCDVVEPKACDELKKILVEALNMPAEPKVRRDRWETIAQELESFPTGK